MIDEVAVYLSTLTDTQVQDLAQSGKVPPLKHFIWGQREIIVKPGESIQAAVESLHREAGGTVLIAPAPGPYTENKVLKSNVRIKTNGGTVHVNGTLRTPTISPTTLTDDGSDFLTGDRVLDVSNTRAAGDCIRVLGTAGSPSPLRHDRRWNSEAESNDPDTPDIQTFVIESRTASDMTFVGNGSAYDFADGDRGSIQAFTPTSWVAAEGDLRFSANGPVVLSHTRDFRIVGIRATNTHATSLQGIEFGRACIYGQARDCIVVQATDPDEQNDGIRAIQSASDIVCKNIDVSEGRHGCDVAGKCAWWSRVAHRVPQHHLGQHQFPQRGWRDRGLRHPRSFY